MCECTILSHLTCALLEVFAMREMPIITLSIVKTISSFVVEIRLSPPPTSKSNPFSTSGSEFSTSFLHLVRESAFLKARVVKSSVTGPPRRRGYASGFQKEIVHTSTDPISLSVELSLLLLLLLSADSGTLGCSMHFFRSPCSTDASVMSVSCSKLRFASGTLTSNAEPLLILTPSW